ncbi:MFS transporter [Janibacter limosus]|jgi:MFS family permease|uniref:MFS transporter n=1 Tax=Janibacter limosus TaxID=53458 RepID=A0A4P6MVN4_9MICO|nr:MFS transporter [Janibacter limosus]QBF47079.1 MFS transporter [Janibacter limosus]
MSSGEDFGWRRIVVPAYGPTLLSASAAGAVVPIAALRADELGASLGMAAFVVALTGVGQLLGVLPAGALVARIGERATLIRAGLLDVAALAVAGWAPSLWLMGAALLVSGLATSAFFLARQGYMIDVLPQHLLARGMSLLGGAMRAGLLLGPVVGALAIAPFGLQGAYGVAALLALGSALTVLTAPDLTADHERARAGQPRTGIFRVIRRHARLLLTQGVGVTVISALRSARLAILPLWALHIGLDGVDSSQIFAAAGVAELFLVYPGGWMMDRLGRLWVVAALLVVVSASFLVLPWADSKGELLAVALFMALGNGLGSGIVMTLGADNAPAADRAQFLGAWRLTGEVGHASGTLGLSAVTAVASLPVAAVTLGVLGLGGLAWTSGWMARADRERLAR